MAGQYHQILTSAKRRLMKKQLYILASLLGAGSSIIVATTSEFRSPLRLIRGVMHSYLSPVYEAFWFDQMPECRTPSHWYVDVWGAGYSRTACEAFFDPCGGNTTKTTSLSALFFGAESFTAQQVFVNGTISPDLLTATTTSLVWSVIDPRFIYDENGVVFGTHVRYTIGDSECWHVGFRAGLPVKRISVEVTNAADLVETISDVVLEQPLCQGTNSGLQTDYAYRLDFLTALSRCSSMLGVQVPMVNYDDGTGSPTNAGHATTIGGTLTLVSTDTPEGTGAGVNEYPAAYVVRVAGSGGNCLFTDAPTGQVPTTPYCKTPDQVTGGALAANGSGGAIGDTMFFEFGTNYAAGLGVDTNAQSALFVVPRCDNINGVITEPLSAVSIYQAVHASLPDLSSIETATEFFAGQGIDFGRSECILGVGDFDVEFYGGYGQHHKAFLDGIIGMRFPTGTRPPNATRIYYQPTGNKKHYEIKLEVEGGWQPVNCFAFRLDAAYYHVFKGSECRAAPFKQQLSPCQVTSCCTNTCTNTCNTNSSTCCFDSSSSCCESEKNNYPCIDCSTIFIKNIGPNLCVDVSWDYFVGHIEFTIFHPCNRELGMTFGYEPMYKGKDHVSGDDCDCMTTGVLTATDLLGNENQPLDLSILEDRSQTTTHKLYVELFHRWNYFELFGGASQIVAGQNAMKESEIHLGMKFFF